MHAPVKFGVRVRLYQEMGLENLVDTICSSLRRLVTQHMVVFEAKKRKPHRPINKFIMFLIQFTKWMYL